MPKKAKLFPHERQEVASIKALMVRKGMDQVELARKLRYSRQSVNNVLRERSPMSRGLRIKLAELFGFENPFHLIIEPRKEQ